MLKHRQLLPGFGLTLGFTVAYLSLLVLIPLAGIFVKTATTGFDHFIASAFDPRAIASYKLTFGISLAAALVNGFFGLIVAWVLVRYRFPFKKVVDSLVDLPFALPTAVAGISLATLYAPKGWIGSMFAPTGWIGSALVADGWIGRFFPPDGLAENGIKIAFTPLGIFVALTFIGLPFVVRTVQPVLEDLESDAEEAAASLGAGRWKTITRVVLPELTPAVITGVALAFARAVGEYGSVVFIAGNMPMISEITPLLIITKLEQYDYSGATSLAVVMLCVSFALLLTINAMQAWASRRSHGV